MTRQAITVAVALAVTAVFTWPAPTLPTDVVVARGFDAPGMLWMGWYMPHRFPVDGLTSVVSRFPEGERLQESDGWLYLLAAWLVPGAGGAPGYHLWAWLGSAATFLAAERFAARVGQARWPWSMAAGLVFACNGVAAAALVNGRAYHLAQWPLPAFLLAAHAAVRGPRPRAAATAAGALWVLCLLTSLYTAALASAALAWGWAWSERRAQALVRLLPAVPWVLIATLWFAWVFSGRADPRQAGWDLPIPGVTGSATLLGLLGWCPATDDVQGYAVSTLGFASLGLALAGVRLAPRRAAWALLGGAMVAVLLSLGPAVLAFPFPNWPPLADTPMGWLMHAVPSLRLFRFPVRFLLLAHLALGTLASQALALSRGRALRFALAGALVVDAMVWCGPVWRGRTTWSLGHDAYAAAPSGRPVLDLVPETPAFVNPTLLDAIRDGCASQAQGGPAVFDDCLHHTTVGTPGTRLRERLLPVLVEEDAAQARSVLGEAGAGAVAVHADLFRDEELAAIDATLQRIAGAPVADANAAGERVRLYALP